MGLRFRKSVKIAPGVKLNVGKKSAGISVGGKYGGVSYNTKTGTKARVSAPGTGLSYTTKVGGSTKEKSSKTTASSDNNSNDNNGSCLMSCLKIFGALLLLGLFAQFGWIAGIVWFIFFRKKLNDDPQKQKKYTIIIAILSVLSFFIMLGSVNSSPEDENIPTNTESEINTEIDSETILSTEQDSEYESVTEIESTTENATTPDDETLSETESTTENETVSEGEPRPEKDTSSEVPTPETDTTTEAESTPETDSTSDVSTTPPSTNESVMVWVDDTAARYHSKNGCGMDNAYQVTLEEAQAMGKTPCGRCY